VLVSVLGLALNGQPSLGRGIIQKNALSGRGVPATSKDQRKPAHGKADPNHRVVCENRKARHNYLVLDTLECGLVLVGSEVKSLRNGRVSLDESYARVKDGEVWLIGCDIPEYIEANRFNHIPKRPRKLLLHRREIDRFASRAFEKGLTLVPLKLYFSKGRAKLLLGICRGRKEYDKREAMKEAAVKRDIQRIMRRRS
jgi:SsrA-binding protein